MVSGLHTDPLKFLLDLQSYFSYVSVDFGHPECSQSFWVLERQSDLFFVYLNLLLFKNETGC